MPYKKKTATAPAWMRQPPNNNEMKLVKSKAYKFLEEQALSGTELVSATQ